MEPHLALAEIRRLVGLDGDGVDEEVIVDLRKGWRKRGRREGVEEEGEEGMRIQWSC